MLQNLLAERFGLKMHRETKEMTVYALETSKNGPKLKESRPAPTTTDQAMPGNPAQLPRNKDGFLVLPEGRPVHLVTTGHNGRLHGSRGCRRWTISPLSWLISQVSSNPERPVIDRTGLTGRYDINIEMSAMNRSGANGAAGAVPAQAGLVPAMDPDSAPALATTLEQLGLKLESAKAPITFFVVDQASKTPEPN